MFGPASRSRAVAAGWAGRAQCRTSRTRSSRRAWDVVPRCRPDTRRRTGMLPSAWFQWPDAHSQGRSGCFATATQPSFVLALAGKPASVMARATAENVVRSGSKVTVTATGQPSGRSSIFCAPTVSLKEHLNKSPIIVDNVASRRNASPGGTILDATIIHAPPSTRNRDKVRDRQMHQTGKGNQWFFGIKAHIGVDDECGQRDRDEQASVDGAPTVAGDGRIVVPAARSAPPPWSNGVV